MAPENAPHGIRFLWVLAHHRTRPAGVADFAWWSGLTLGQSREAVGPGKNGMVRPVVIERGRVIGTWSHAEATRHAPPELCATASDPEAVRAAVDRGVRLFGA